MGDELKSAYELAMERLRAQDREAGIKESKPLTAAQKKEIAELRQEAKAKLAEIEIEFDKQKTAATDPEKLTELEEHYQIDRRRIESSLESQIARVKKG